MCKLRLRLATRKVENRSLKDKAKEVNAINTQDKANVISHREIREAKVLNSRINEDLHLRLVASVDHPHRGRIKVNKPERRLCIQRMNRDVNLHLYVSLLHNNQEDSLLHNNQGDNHPLKSQGDSPLHNNQGDSLLLSNNSRENSQDVSPLRSNQGDSHRLSSLEDNLLLKSLSREISSANSQTDASPLHNNQGDNLHLSSLSREISSVNSHKDVSPLPSSHNKLNNRPHLSGGKQLTDRKATQILNIPTKSLNHPLYLHGLQGQLTILSQ